MRTMTRRLTATALLTIAAGAGIAGCGGKDGGLGATPAAAVVGTWNATTFVAQGSDLIALGMTLSFSFNNAGGYSFSVTNDQGGLCTGTTSCSDTGSYTATATVITLDPGTVDETILNYTIVGTTMTVTATVNGTTITATFAKV